MLGQWFLTAAAVAAIVATAVARRVTMTASEWGGESEWGVGKEGVEELVVEGHGDFGRRGDTAVGSGALADFGAGGQVGDDEGTASEHQLRGEVVGVDSDWGWVVGGDDQVQNGCFLTREGVGGRGEGEGGRDFGNRLRLHVSLLLLFFLSPLLLGFLWALS